MTELDQHSHGISMHELDEATRHWSERFDVLGTEPIPTDRFISQAYFDKEREMLFRRNWINVGSVHDFSEADGFFVRDIEVLGVSLLIVRKHNRIQAYHNVCAHRGMKLLWERDGTCPKMFTCRFHGWAYGSSDGALEHVPDRDQFYFDSLSERGLTPVTTDTWGGFIFINMLDKPEQPLREYLGPFADQMEGFPFDKLTLQYRYEIPEQVNWKISIDAQNEIYHVPMLAPVHRFLSGGAFHTNDDGYTRLAGFDTLGRHTRYTSESDPDFEDTPSGKAHAAQLPGFAERILPMDTPFSFNVIFPNMVIAFFNNSMFTYNFWPHEVDKTVWEIRLHYPEPKNLAERVLVEQAKCRFRDLLCEDQVGHESLQAGLRSGARNDFVVGEQEIQIRAFHASVDAAMNKKGTTNV